MANAPPLTAGCLDLALAPDQRARVLALLNERLHPTLRHIVAAEVARGNRVCDAGTDWPDAGSVHVTMSQRFTGRHANAQAAFSLCDDPHYWHADYSTAGTPRHLLIC